MNRSRVLILEEDAEMRAIISAQLPQSEHVVELCAHYQDALQKLKSGGFHLLLVDQKIPEIASADFLGRVREFAKPSELAILMTAFAQSDEANAKLKECGASAVLTKPFERSALLLLLKECLKQIKPTEGSFPPQSGKRVKGDIVLDTKSFDVFCKGERIHLTPNEFKLLKVLMENDHQVLSREELIDLVQGHEIAVVDRAVDTHIFSLRKKLGVCGEQIETVRGSGYRIKALS